MKKYQFKTLAEAYRQLYQDYLADQSNKRYSREMLEYQWVQHVNISDYSKMLVIRFDDRSLGMSLNFINSMSRNQMKFIMRKWVLK